MQNFKSTLDNLKQIFKAFGRKLSLGAPVACNRRAEIEVSGNRASSAHVVGP